MILLTRTGFSIISSRPTSKLDLSSCYNATDRPDEIVRRSLHAWRHERRD